MCSFEIVGNETTREESGFDRVSEFFLFGTGVAMENGRAARPPTPLATAPAALVLAGSAFAAIYDFGPKTPRSEPWICTGLNKPVA